MSLVSYDISNVNIIFQKIKSLNLTKFRTKFEVINFETKQKYPPKHHRSGQASLGGRDYVPLSFLNKYSVM